MIKIHLNCLDPMCLSVSYVKYATFLLNLTPIETLRDRKKNFHKKKGMQKKKNHAFFSSKKNPNWDIKGYMEKMGFCPYLAKKKKKKSNMSLFPN